MAPKKEFKRGYEWAVATGKDVEDAAEPLEIKLTRADVNSATQKDPTCCAFAKSIERQEYAAAAWVGISYAYVEWADVVLRYVVPPSISRELVSFDRSKIAEIGFFHLSPPAESVALGRKRKKPSGPHRREMSPNGKHYTANIRSRG